MAIKKRQSSATQPPKAGAKLAFAAALLALGVGVWALMNNSRQTAAPTRVAEAPAKSAKELAADAASSAAVPKFDKPTVILPEQKAAVPDFNNSAAANPRTAGQAIVPSFDPPPTPATGPAAAKFDPSRFAKYMDQIAKDHLPTLADWQTLSKSIPRDMIKDFKIPIGEGHFVMSLCLDLQNRLWVGTEGEGLWRFDGSQPADKQWTQFTTADGLGDDYIYALACDHQGRVWCGHLNHGISVIAGDKIQMYEVVAGLSNPTSLNGPLGERIFHITVAPDFNDPPNVAPGGNQRPTFHDALTNKDSPVSGSIWMCTSAGLAVYFPSTDTWSYLTRADGLPSDQANSLAFGQDGTVYVATQCDGIAIALAADHYATWKQITVENSNPEYQALLKAQDSSLKTSSFLPTTPTGSGLPTNLMNDILVTQVGTVYAATTAGITWSMDKGQTWQFTRGTDYSDKVKDRANGPPMQWSPQVSSTLTEDYVTAIAEDARGNIVLGHRAGQSDILCDESIITNSSTEIEYIACFGQSPNLKNTLIGTYGRGIGTIVGTTVGAVPKALPSPLASIFPAGQNRSNALDMLIRNETSSQTASIAFLGEDWATAGDWLGRYGRQYACLCAANSPFNDTFGFDKSFSVTAKIGPHVKPGDKKRNWLDTPFTDNPNSLWDPLVGSRREAEWDDHGEEYSSSWEGPNLLVEVPLPEGAYRVSLYFFDPNGHAHARSHSARDFLVAAGVAASNEDDFATLAQIRVRDFHGGVYLQFLAIGGATYRFEVKRNYSINAILNGVFIDRVLGATTRFDKLGLPDLGGQHYDPPKLPTLDSLSKPLQPLIAGWSQLRAANGLLLFSMNARSNHILTYRAIAEAAPQELLAYWRWNMPIWSSNDRADWWKVMKEGWNSFLKVNPEYAQKHKFAFKD